MRVKTPASGPLWRKPDVSEEERLLGPCKPTSDGPHSTESRRVVGTLPRKLAISGIPRVADRPLAVKRKGAFSLPRGGTISGLGPGFSRLAARLR